MIPNPVPSPLPLLGLALAALTATACHETGASQRELMNVTGAWFAAIERRDFVNLARFDANAPDPGTPVFNEWAAAVEARLDAYEVRRAEGNWEPDATGYVPVRAFLLGANPGTYWGAPGREGTLEEPVLIIQATFAYDEISEQGFAPGTKVHVQGFPVGKVHRMEIGGNDRRQISILDRIRLKVHLKHVPPRSEKEFPYKVVRCEIVPGSAIHRDVTWIF